MAVEIAKSIGTMAVDSSSAIDVIIRLARQVKNYIFRHPVSAQYLVCHQALDDDRKVLQKHKGRSEPEGLDQAFIRLHDEFKAGREVRLRILIQGKPRALTAAEEEQIYLISREAVVNALRHSGARLVEVEVEYKPRRVWVRVRDNGCGFGAEVAQSEWRSRWGLRSMHERAKSIGGQLRIWTRRGAGTEIEILVPLDEVPG
jgi:signal transduction histidine kinase